jgi:peptidoglycan/xylan/chitin deacetylase (PgdA/CDA1 family)
MGLRRLGLAAAASRPFGWVMGLFERLNRDAPDLLRVLTYHHVESSDADPPPYPRGTIAPEAFAEQMRWLRERCHVVSMEEVLAAVERRGGLPPRSVLVTFDDGYRDFGTRAWPVLRGLGLPVTLFVPTAFPGDPGRWFWWERLHHALLHTARRRSLVTPVGSLALDSAATREQAYTRLRAHVKRMPHAEALEWVEAACRELATPPPPPPAILSWDELRELAGQGVTIGSHTRTHPLLTRIARSQAQAEIACSLSDLKRELGRVLPVLAYPGGAHDPDVVRITAEAGYRLAFTTTRGLNRLERVHPLELRRINVGRSTSLGLLRAQLVTSAAGALAR